MRIKLGFLVVLFLLTVSTSAFASTYVYVGSWEVNSGPWWTDQPQAYSGQQAAAMLFGGNAGDYAISTTGMDTSYINHLAWYSVLGYVGDNYGGIAFAENYLSSNSSQATGYYYSGNSNYTYDDPTEAASAYVADNAGLGNVNYAFRIEGSQVPLPSALLLFGPGLAGLGLLRRRFTK